MHINFPVKSKQNDQKPATDYHYNTYKPSHLASSISVMHFHSKAEMKEALCKYKLKVKNFILKRASTSTISMWNQTAIEYRLLW